MKLLPLALADFRSVRAVFTDVDGTLTTGGKLASKTLLAMEHLAEAGVDLVLVSGRSAGWGEAWARQWPVAAVIVENGGLAFVWRKGRLHRVYSEPPRLRQRNRAQLKRHVRNVISAVPRAKLSSDSRYTEVDLAIDYAEEVDLGTRGADLLERRLLSRGVRAVRSSVHINCWMGPFDKATAVRQLLKREWKTQLHSAHERRFVYVGDSFNDQPLFEAFALSVGVANVREIAQSLKYPPRYVTRFKEGRGFVEVAHAVLRARGC